MRKDIEKLVGDFYRETLRKHGPTPAGVSWPNAPDLATRFETLLSGVDFGAYDESRRLRLLDLGCGPGLLLDWLADNALLSRIDYTGVDVTEDTMRHARERWPGMRFDLRDVRDDPFDANTFDYCIACGVFTSRVDNTYADMERLVKETLRALWPSVTSALAFNVMSKHVDWEREDLFHWPLDEAMAFCKAHLSRHVSFRLDYGLWETALIVRRNPMRRSSRVPSRWVRSGG